MPSWKKVILSGSDAALNSLNVTNGVTGSLFGTSSWAQNAVTASYTNVGSLGGFIQNGNSFGTTAVLGTNDNNSLALETNGSTKMFISSSGNVGIGTSAPTSLLELKQSNIPRITLLKTGIISWYIGNPSQSTSNNFSIGTDSGGNTEILTLTNGGNVGIGTSSPTFSAGGGLQVVRSDYANVRVTGGSSLGLDLLQSSDGTGYLRNRDNAQLRLGTNNVDVITITNTGNVGIGITAPASKFHVYQNDTLIDQTAGITIEQDGTGNAILQYLQTGAYRWVTGIDNSDGDKFKIGRGISWGLGQDLTIDTSGNVGIGTTSPDQKLVISGTTNIYSKIVTSGVDSTLGINLVNDARSWVVRVDGADGDKFQIRDASAGTQRITIDTSGNVGIGTTSPGATLDVEGDVLIKAANLSNQENTDVDTGTEVIATVAIATYTAAFFDFVVKNGTNVRSGTVFACHDGTNVEFTETSTADLGTTSALTLSVDISSGNMRLLATATTDNWSVKTLVRAL